MVLLKSCRQDGTVTISLIPSDATGLVASEGVYVPLSKSIYGALLADEDSVRWREIRRSSQSVTQSIRGADDETILGHLTVSASPAIGREILDSVTSGWLLASGVAVILAAFAGWIISLRITQPLTRLTEATVAMTDGDLSVRTTIQRPDELGTLAQSFNSMADRIENTVTTLRRFVADAAHELYTPLTALRTNLELAQEQQDTPAVGRALDQVMRIQALAEGLLDLSRLAGADSTSSLTANDMNVLIRETADSFASRVVQNEISLSLELEDSPVCVDGSAHLLTRMLENLLDNAIKFTPQHGCVKVTTQTIEGSVQVTIKDSGIGIPEEDLPHLFERFRRGRNTADYPGSGLGLAIVKAIVERHRGEVTIRSSSDGTCVTVKLPVQG